MEKKYKLEPEAKQDLMDAVTWYEEKQSGVGEHFFHEVNERILQISKKPDSFSKFYRDFRKAPIKKFPYYIFYIIKKTYISIVAILHTKRHPETLQKRTEK